MNEKASRKEVGEDTIPKNVPDFPGIPEGEELALGPVDGDEIDPLPKWWDESIEAERSKVGNRRLEDGIELEAPRRKKLRPLPAESNVEEDPAGEPVITASERDPIDAIADAEAAQPVAAADPSFDGRPEIDLGAIKVKHRPKSEAIPEGLADGDLAVFFSDVPKAGATGEASTPLTEAPLPDKSTGSPADSAPVRKAGPPPMPVTAKEEAAFEMGFEAQAPLIPGSKPVVKAIPPVKAVAPVEPEQPAKQSAELDADAKPEGVTEVIEEGPTVEAPKEEIPEVAVEEAVIEVPEEKDPAEKVPATTPAAEEPEKNEAPAGPSESEVAESEAPGSQPEESVAVIGGPLPSSNSPDAPSKKKAGCWTVFATLFFFATVLVVGLIVAAGVFAWSRVGEFEKKITALARTKLEEQGIHLDHGPWSYEFPRGLVFDEVTVYDDASKQRAALKVSGLGVNVDLLSLVKGPGRIGSAEFSLNDSRVTFFEKGETFAEIEGVSGEILADASAITIERLAASVGGLRVRLDGIVSLPDKTANSGDAAATGGAAAPKASPLAAIDFSGFRALQPWLGIESAGDTAPLLDLSVTMNAGEPDLATIEGSLSGTGVTWHGMDFKSLSADFRIDPKTGELLFPNVQAGYGEGLIGAVLAVDMAAQKLKIERLQSSVDIAAMLTACDPAWAGKFKSVRFVDAPTLQVSGEMPLGEPANADLEILYEQRMGIVYLDGERELPLSDIRGKFVYDRGALETNDAAAKLFGGQVFVNGATNLIRENRPFTGLVEITEMPLDQAAVWFGQDGAGLTGRLFLTFRGTGNSSLESINGGGNLRIEEAALPKFPIVGPVQALLGKVVPAFASKSSGSVTGAYIIESGVLVTSDLTVRNGGARVVTNGSVNLVKQETTFVSTADLEPSLAAATGLKDKAIQVEGSGPLRAPTLKIKQFPIEFAAAGLGEVLGTTPESLGAIKEVLGTGDTAGVITGTIEEATGLKIDPAVTDLLKGLLGGDKPATPAPALRAVPQN